MQLAADLKKKKIDHSKSQKALEDKVISELLASDAAKAKLKATADSSNMYATVNPYGPILTDSSLKPTGTKPKSSTKGDANNTKTDTRVPAKRTRDERSHPVSADYPTYKTGPQPLGAGLKGSPKKLQKQGHHTDDKAQFFVS